MPNIIHRCLREKLPFWLAVWFGAGLAPKAPGTVGTLAALPFAAIIQWIWGNTGLLLAALLLFAIGIWASNVYRRLTSAEEDPSAVVVDEVAAMWLMLSFMPPTPLAYTAGFLLFRLFDVLKPWPVSLADRRVKGGLGIMLDDVLAAAMGLGLLWALTQLWPHGPVLFDNPFKEFLWIQH